MSEGNITTKHYFSICNHITYIQYVKINSAFFSFFSLHLSKLCSMYQKLTRCNSYLTLFTFSIKMSCPFDIFAI